MEIKDYIELNALNKLLAKVKFQDDLDFYEFKEFVGSPIIAEIFRRINHEFWNESVKLGYVEDRQKSKFKYDSLIGETLKKRIDELTDQEKKCLLQNDGIEFFVKILITPLEVEEVELNKMLKYAEESFKTCT